MWIAHLGKESAQSSNEEDDIERKTRGAGRLTAEALDGVSFCGPSAQISVLINHLPNLFESVDESSIHS